MRGATPSVANSSDSFDELAPVARDYAPTRESWPRKMCPDTDGREKFLGVEELPRTCKTF